MPTTAFDALAEQRFVSLTTFRKSGVAVSSPVWIARDGAALLVTTPVDSGKVKRLRNSARCELRPCTRTGKVPEGAERVPGIVHLFSDAPTVERSTAIFKAKYGLEYWVVMGIEQVMTWSELRPRAILRITPA